MTRRVFDMPRTIVLVAGGRWQANTPGPARQLFKSAWFQKAAAYAAHIGERWYILSAAHGLVSPDDILLPQPLSFSDLAQEARQAWIRQTTQSLQAILQPGDRVILLAGKTCCDLVSEPIRQIACGIERPLQGMGITGQIAWLNKELLV